MKTQFGVGVKFHGTLKVGQFWHVIDKIELFPAYRMFVTRPKLRKFSRVQVCLVQEISGSKAFATRHIPPEHDKVGPYLYIHPQPYWEMKKEIYLPPLSHREGSHIVIAMMTQWHVNFSRTTGPLCENPGISGFLVLRGSVVMRSYEDFSQLAWTSCGITSRIAGYQSRQSAHVTSLWCHERFTIFDGDQ